MSKLLLALLTVSLAACGGQGAVDAALQRMRTQPRYDPYERSAFFRNGAVMQPPPEGTVPRGQVLAARSATGREPGGGYVAETPLPLSRELLDRGRSRFEIYCAVCHGAGGYGGSVVAYNMIERRPPSLRRPELSQLPAGYYYQVITQGLGRMPSYAADLSVADRWAVIAYVRKLQRRTGATAQERDDSVRAAQLRSLDDSLARDSLASDSLASRRP
jgi:mono/diheme cytochrome c family protein